MYSCFLYNCVFINSCTVYRKLNPNSDTSFYKCLQTLAEEFIACDSECNDQGNLRWTSTVAGTRTRHDGQPHRRLSDMKMQQLERIPQLGRRKYPQKIM